MLSVVIPVCNRADLTDQVLKGLWFTSSKTDQIVVVDNGSTDMTPLILFEHGKHFRDKLLTLRNPTNEGFAKATNAGIRVSQGDVILLLNNDVQIQRIFQRQIVDALAENPKRIVCGRLVDWKAGWNQFQDLVIPYAEAWCLGFTRAALADIGYLDERFSPAYYEDVDWSYRAVQKGYEIMQLKLPITHLGGGSAGQLDAPIGLTERQRLVFAEKWGLKC
jgi:GT2 family glycosyltransferase